MKLIDIFIASQRHIRVAPYNQANDLKYSERSAALDAVQTITNLDKRGVLPTEQFRPRFHKSARQLLIFLTFSDQTLTSSIS